MPPKMSGKAKMAVIRRVSKYLFAHKGLVAICFLMMLTSNLLALAAPKLSQAAIDDPRLWRSCSMTARW